MKEQSSSFEDIELLDENTISVEELTPTRALKVVSLFSGCGGMDLGFRGDFKIFGKYY